MGNTSPLTFRSYSRLAADVRDYVWRTGARLNLPLAWLPDRIACGRFALEEPPSRPSEWVGDVLRQARVFVQRLEHMDSLGRDDVHLVSLPGLFTMLRPCL